MDYELTSNGNSRPANAAEVLTLICQKAKGCRHTEVDLMRQLLYHREVRIDDTMIKNIGNPITQPSNFIGV